MSDPQTQAPDPAPVRETPAAEPAAPAPAAEPAAASKPKRERAPKAAKPSADLRPVLTALAGLVRAMRDTLPSQVQDEADAVLKAAAEAGL